MTEAGEQQLRGRFMPAEIVRRLDLTDDLWRIWLRPEMPFPFKAGQYCTIGTGGIERPYSIASPPSEPEIELFIELIPPPDGELTPLLYELREGATVTMRPRAKGLFVLKPEFRNHVMVSTVTGITPFVSMLRHHLEQPLPDHRFFVLEGASYFDEFGYDKELNELALAHEEITYIPTASRPGDSKNAAWTGETGRVNTIVEAHLEQLGLSTGDTLVYTCGHPLMIEDVRRRLEGTGFQLEEERFWKEEDGER